MKLFHTAICLGVLAANIDASLAQAPSEKFSIAVAKEPVVKIPEFARAKQAAIFSICNTRSCNLAIEINGKKLKEFVTATDQKYEVCKLDRTFHVDGDACSGQYNEFGIGVTYKKMDGNAVSFRLTGQWIINGSGTVEECLSTDVEPHDQMSGYEVMQPRRKWILDGILVTLFEF